jgi:hypothetical protein
MNTKTREEQLAYLKNMKDEDINFEDDPEITEQEIKNIRPNHLFFKARKKKATFTLDLDIIAWLQKHKNASGFLNELLKKESLKHA